MLHYYYMAFFFQRHNTQPARDLGSEFSHMILDSMPNMCTTSRYATKVGMLCTHVFGTHVPSPTLLNDYEYLQVSGVYSFQNHLYGHNNFRGFVYRHSQAPYKLQDT